MRFSYVRVPFERGRSGGSQMSGPDPVEICCDWKWQRLMEPTSPPIFPRRCAALRNIKWLQGPPSSTAARLHLLRASFRTTLLNWQFRLAPENCSGKDQLRMIGAVQESALVLLAVMPNRTLLLHASPVTSNLRRQVRVFSFFPRRRFHFIRVQPCRCVGRPRCRPQNSSAPTWPASTS